MALPLAFLRQPVMRACLQEPVPKLNNHGRTTNDGEKTTTKLIFICVLVFCLADKSCVTAEQILCVRRRSRRAARARHPMTPTDYTELALVGITDLRVAQRHRVIPDRLLFVISLSSFVVLPLCRSLRDMTNSDFAHSQTTMKSFEAPFAWKRSEKSYQRRTLSRASRLMKLGTGTPFGKLADRHIRTPPAAAIAESSAISWKT